jgi:hypothetical protein
MNGQIMPRLVNTSTLSSAVKFETLGSAMTAFGWQTACSGGCKEPGFRLRRAPVLHLSSNTRRNSTGGATSVFVYLGCDLIFS